MRRILHIGKFFPPATGGIENFLYDLSKYQALSNLKVSVLVHNHQKSRRKHSDTNQFGVRIFRIPTIGNLLYAPISPTFVPALKKITKLENPDIIHIHMPNLSALAVLFTNPTIPLVVHWHSDITTSDENKMFKCAYRYFYKFFERMLLNRARAVIVTSEPYLKSSKPLKSFRHKCKVIPLGLDPNRLEIAGNFRHLKHNEFFVMSAGRFTYYKGFQYLIRAAGIFSKGKIVISGGGQLLHELKCMVDELGLKNRVKLPGELPPHKLYGLMRNCSVFCLPSIERTEAFGLVLLEAMHFGKPLITTRIEGSGVTWVNKNGVTGIHVSPKNEFELAGAIDFLYQNPEIRKLYGANAKSRVRELFHIQKVTEQIKELYDSI